MSELYAMDLVHQEAEAFRVLTILRWPTENIVCRWFKIADDRVLLCQFDDEGWVNLALVKMAL